MATIAIELDRIMKNLSVDQDESGDQTILKVVKLKESILKKEKEMSEKLKRLNGKKFTSSDFFQVFL